MFFIAIGVVIGVPHLIHLTNRVLKETMIPRRDMRALQKRRKEQAAAGIPEEQREVMQYVPFGEMCPELTHEEFRKLQEIGALDIIKRACWRRPHVKKVDDA